MDSEARRPLQGLVSDNCSLDSLATVLLSCKTAEGLQNTDDIASLLPTPDGILSWAKARVSRDFPGACLYGVTWLALLARHNAAGEAAAHVSGDELDMKLHNWLYNTSGGERAVVMPSRGQDLSHADSEELVFLLTQIVEKWRASAINDQLTRSTMVQSLTYAAQFVQDWISTSKRLVQAGAIWPIMHTLQHPTDYDDDSTQCLTAFTLATMLTRTNTLSFINEVLLIDGVELLGRAIFSLDGSLVHQSRINTLIEIALHALGKITSHAELRGNAAPTCMQLLAWLLPKLTNADFLADFLADQRCYAVQILGNITDSKADAEAGATQLLVAYLSTFQRQYFDIKNDSGYTRHELNPNKWISHAMCNLSHNESLLGWIDDSEVVVGWLMRAIHVIFEGYEILQSVHAVHTLANMAEVETYKITMVNAGVNRGLKEFLATCEASISFYHAFPAKHELSLEQEDAGLDQDENPFAFFERFILSGEYQRVQEHIARAVESLK